MALGCNGPELFTNAAALFITHSDVGFGTVVGSEIFNLLLIVGGSVLATPNISSTSPLKLEVIPYCRDITWYLISIILLILVLWDNVVTLWESLFLLICAGCFGMSVGGTRKICQIYPEYVQMVFDFVQIENPNNPHRSNLNQPALKQGICGTESSTGSNTGIEIHVLKPNSEEATRAARISVCGNENPEFTPDRSPLNNIQHLLEADLESPRSDRSTPKFLKQKIHPNAYVHHKVGAQLSLSIAVSKNNENLKKYFDTDFAEGPELTGFKNVHVHRHHKGMTAISQIFPLKTEEEAQNLSMTINSESGLLEIYGGLQFKARSSLGLDVDHYQSVNYINLHHGEVNHSRSNGHITPLQNSNALDAPLLENDALTSKMSTVTTQAGSPVTVTETITSENETKSNTETFIKSPTLTEDQLNYPTLISFLDVTDIHSGSHHLQHQCKTSPPDSISIDVRGTWGEKLTLSLTLDNTGGGHKIEVLKMLQTLTEAAHRDADDRGFKIPVTPIGSRKGSVSHSESNKEYNINPLLPGIPSTVTVVGNSKRLSVDSRVSAGSNGNSSLCEDFSLKKVYEELLHELEEAKKDSTMPKHSLFLLYTGFPINLALNVSMGWCDPKNPEKKSGFLAAFTISRFNEISSWTLIVFVVAASTP